MISLGADDGTSVVGGPARPELTAKTTSKGVFTIKLTTVPGRHYAAVAQYGGSIRYQAVQSRTVKLTG